MVENAKGLKTEAKNTLEWLEVRLDVGDDKRLMYKRRIETLNSDGDALKQECCLAHRIIIIIIIAVVVVVVVVVIY